MWLVPCLWAWNCGAAVEVPVCQPQAMQSARRSRVPTVVPLGRSEDEREHVQRKKMAIEEIEALLAEMPEAEQKSGGHSILQ